MLEHDCRVSLECEPALLPPSTEPHAPSQIPSFLKPPPPPLAFHLSTLRKHPSLSSSPMRPCRRPPLYSACRIYRHQIHFFCGVSIRQAGRQLGDPLSLSLSLWLRHLSRTLFFLVCKLIWARILPFCKHLLSCERCSFP